jgi:predicted dehydrogenase
MESRIGALKDGPYGRCVFHCDNNVVDHQVVNMEFDNGVTAAFTMCAFTNDCNRSIKLMGTKGEIRASDKNNEIEIHEFGKGAVEIIKLDISKYGHGGGDYGIMYDFIRSVAKGNASTGLTNATASVQSHLMAFAAEKSRLEGHVVDLKEYENSLRITI